MTWLWAVEDMDLRVTFARANSPTDILTLITRWVVTRVTFVLAIVLFPADKAMRIVGMGLIAVVLGLLVLILLTGIWFLIWLLLMGSSRIWLSYPLYRPILFVPGMIIAVFAHIFIMLVPDPHKNPKYTILAQEWPLSWRLRSPTEAYFEANPRVPRDE